MSKFFETCINRMEPELLSKGYTKGETKTGNESYAVYNCEDDTLLIKYAKDAKRFYLCKGEAGAKADDCGHVQTYYFDENSGDGEREANSIALEFLDTLSKPVAVSRERIAAVAKQAKKEESGDCMDVAFFINRIPTSFPECRLPLISHKEYYGEILPLKFCEETVCAALADNLKKGNTARLNPFFELLSTGYEKGDMDTKSIIVQVLLNSITDDEERALAESKLSEQLRKAWHAGRKYIGKEVKPEPISTAKKLAEVQATAERLQSTRRR